MGKCPFSVLNHLPSTSCFPHNSGPTLSPTMRIMILNPNCRDRAKSETVMSTLLTSLKYSTAGG